MINSEGTYISSTSPTPESVINGERIIGGSVPTTEISVTSSNKHKATNDTLIVTSSSSRLPSVTGTVEPVPITHTIEIVTSSSSRLPSVTGTVESVPITHTIEIIIQN